MSRAKRADLLARENDCLTLLEFIRGDTAQISLLTSIWSSQYTVRSNSYISIDVSVFDVDREDVDDSH